MTTLLRPDELWRDVRHAIRVLNRAPGHTAAIVLLVALGVGGSCAIFALANALFMRNLPVHHPEDLVLLRRMARGTSQGISIPLFEELRQRLTSVSCVIGIADLVNPPLMLDSVGTDPGDINGVMVSGNYFRCLGITASPGHVFSDEDDRFDDPRPVVVLSHAFWSRQFGGDRSVIGRSVRLSGSSFTVIGVTPGELRALGGERGVGGDFWAPLNLQPVLQPGGDRRRNPAASGLRVMARLAKGASIAQSAAEAQLVYRQLPEPVARPDSSIDVQAGGKGFGGNLTRQYVIPLRLLAAASGLLLLISCANVASLQLARMGTRQRETAVRTALGSGRLRLIRQCLIESALLAGLGGTLGLWLALVGLQAFMAFMAPAVSAAIDPSLDRNLLLFGIAVTFTTALLFGVGPALQSTGADLEAVLRAASTTATGSRSRQFLHRSLVLVQVALAIVLIAASTQFARSLYRLYTVDPGFNRHHVIIARVDGRPAGYQSAEQQADLARRLLDRLSTMAGVRSSSVAAAAFFGGNRRGTATYTVDGREFVPTKDPTLLYTEVSSNYFQLLGVEVVAGRGFTADDRAGTPRVAVVNEAFGRYYFPDRNPIGARLGLGNADDRRGIQIIGVVRDSKLSDLRETTLPLVFLPFEQFPARFNDLLIKVDGPPAGHLAAIRAAVLALDAKLRIDGLQTLDDALLGTLSRDILLMRLSGLLAALSLLLVFFGVYTVVSHVVAARTREIGLRLAFGAEPHRLRRQVVGDALMPVAAGIVVGIGIAMFSERFIEAMLFGATTNDPLTWVAAAAPLILLTLAAAYLPARRASLLDPVKSLRYE